MDVLLDFLEANRALEHATVDVQFGRAAFQDSRRQVGIANHLQSLSIFFNDIAGNNAFISRIPLQKGARLKIRLRDRNAGLSEVLSGIPVTHLSNLQPPTSMVYHPDHRSIELLGPNGSFCSIASLAKIPHSQSSPCSNSRTSRRSASYAVRGGRVDPMPTFPA